MNSAYLLAFVSCVLALTYAKPQPKDVIFGYCYDIKTSPTIDFNKFAANKWFEISRYESTFEENTKCAEQSFIADVNSLTVTFNVQFLNGSQGLLQGAVNYTVAADETLLEATLPGQSSRIPFDILATDYTTYAITYACSEVDNGVLARKDEQIWVLGREPYLSDETKAIVNEALIYNGDSLSTFLYDVNQDDCSA